jgi:2-haloalkanoic acid dehalogenase type II
MSDTMKPFDPSVIRTVTFDAYGTLFQFHDAEFRTAVTEILTAQGLDHPDHDEVYKTLYSSFIKAGPWADQLDGEGQPDWERMASGLMPEWKSTWETWERQWQLTFAAHDLDGDARRAADFTRDGLTVAPAYPEAQEAVERLAASGYTVSLLSNADDDFLDGALAQTEMQFASVQSSEGLQIYKPNRAIFLAHCEQLGVDPSTVLYVGDSLPTDVRGAQGAGLRTAWIKRSERDRALPEGTPVPDVEVSKLTELCDLLKGPSD